MGRGVWLLTVVVFGYLWFVLINQLRVLWALEPQYSYGWAVPFLCAYLVYLAWERGQKAESNPVKYKMQFHGPRPVKYSGSLHRPRTTEDRRQTTAIFHLPSSIHVFLFALLAFLYLPVRLVQAANPEWSLVSWGLALVVIGLTLWFLYFNTPTLQRFNLSFRDLIFPICFFGVAVPWPTVIEDPLIQWLTRVDTRATVELVGWLGIPALPHGNVIEVATGMVGISDACSGIRSFQATLMISLFLGELYRLSGVRRTVLCLGGFAMSFLFNLVRMSVLVWVAASKGIAAIANWHDPGGVTILVACFCGLWAFAVWMENGKQKAEIRKQKPEVSGQRTDSRSPDPTSTPENAPTPRNNPSSILHPPSSILNPSCSPGPAPSAIRHPPSSIRVASPAWPLFALASWIVLTEIGVAGWYGIHESHLPPAQQWTISWPTNNPTFKEQPIEVDALQMLQCDENRRAGWQEDGRQWQAIFIQWNSGTRVSLGHSPNICMTAAGHTLTTITNNDWFDAGGLRLPFTVFEVMDTPQPFYIFYCLWNDRLGTPGSGAMYFSLFGNRLSPVLAGLRASGQRSLEIAVGGVNSAGEAETAVRAELGKILVVTSAPSPPARP